MKKNINKKIQSVIIALLTSFFAGWFPIVFLYAQNVAEISFSEVLTLCKLFAFGSIPVLCIMRLLMKDWYKAAIITTAILVLFQNYSLFIIPMKWIFQDIRLWHYVIIATFFVFFLAYLLIAPLKKDQSKTTCAIILAVFAGLVSVNLATAVPGIVAKIQQQSKKTSLYGTSEHGNRPNFYYFILDECASFPTIQNEYGYANTEYYDFLKDNHFMVSDNSHNKSIQTVVVMANCMNMDYLADGSMNRTQINEFYVSPLLPNVFAENGYRVRGIGNTAWLGVESATYDTKASGETADGETISQLFLKRTCVGPFLNQTQTEKGKLVIETFEAIQKPETINPNSSEMNVFYVESPHVPFIFDENGKGNPPNGYTDWDHPQYYLGQYIFVMKQLQKSIRNILENDPDSVIFISSDHGPRHKPGMPDTEKTRILHAVYYRGEAMEEVRDFSGVDTLRTICNRLLGTDYAMKG